MIEEFLMPAQSANCWLFPQDAADFQDYAFLIVPDMAETWLLCYTFFDNFWYDLIKRKQQGWLANYPNSGITHIIADGLSTEENKQHEYLLSLYRQGVDVTLTPKAPPWNRSCHYKVCCDPNVIMLGSANFTDAGRESQNLWLRFNSPDFWYQYSEQWASLADSLWADYPRAQLGQTRNEH